MKKVMKFVKGKRDDDNLSKIIGNDSRKSFCEKDDHLRDEDLFRDKSITKLHKAVWNENTDKLKNIIKTHDIDITDKLDRTALYLAVLRNNTFIVSLLLENYANQNIPDLDGITPFLKSVQLGYKDCVMILLNYGADLKRCDKDSNTCLHFAVLGTFNELLTILLKNKCDSNTSNANGEYPLHLAVKMKNIFATEILLNYGSLVNVVDNNGMSPLMFAAQQGNLEIIEILEKFVVDIQMKDGKGKTAIDYALAAGFNNVATKLQSKSTLQLKTHSRVNSKSDSSATDTWNDSPVASPSKKQDKPLKKISERFFNADGDLSEENSECEASVKCSQNASPQSGIIPPPCKPLRSLEYIQSGLMLDNRPVHLLTLGTMRTRHISMTESDHSKHNTPQRYSYQGDFQVDLKTDDKPDSASVKSKMLSKIEGDSTIQSDWGSNDSLPLDESSKKEPKPKCKDVATGTREKDTFLRKQFSILENFEKNHERHCSASHGIDKCKKLDENCNKSGSHLDDINNLLEDNNRINAQLERYAGQSDFSIISKKSKSLPRNYEPPCSYYKGSMSLPRTLESGKDVFKEMKPHGCFRPRFMSTSKSMRLEHTSLKKGGFIDKIKNLFIKKSQIHLTGYTEHNSTWLYNRDGSTEHDSVDRKSCKTHSSYSVSDSSGSKKSIHSEKVLNISEDHDADNSSKHLSLSGSEHSKSYERKLLTVGSLSFEAGHSRKSSSSRSFSDKVNMDEVKMAEDIKTSKSSIKYEDENKKLFAEKMHRKEAERDASKMREEADKWKKQYEEIICKINDMEKIDAADRTKISTSEEQRWQNLFQNEIQNVITVLRENSQSVVESLEKHNKKLEALVEKLQNDLEISAVRQQELESKLCKTQMELQEATDLHKAYRKFDSDSERMKSLEDDKRRLEVELELMKKSYCSLDKEYRIHIKEYEENYRMSNNMADDLGMIYYEMQLMKDEIVKRKHELYHKFIEANGNEENIELGCVDQTTSSDIDEITLDKLQRLLSEIQRLHQECNDISSQIKEAEYKKFICALEKTNGNLKEDYACQTQLVEALKMNLRTMENKLNEIENNEKDYEHVVLENAHLKNDNAKILNDMKNTKEEIDNKDDIIRAQNMKLDKLALDLNDQETKRATLETELDKIRKEHANKMHQMSLLNLNCEANVEKISSYEKQLQIVSGENRHLEDVVCHLENSNKILTQQLHVANTNLADQQQKVLVLSNKLTQQEKQNMDLENAIADLSANVSLDEIENKRMLSLLQLENTKLNEEKTIDKGRLRNIASEVDLLKSNRESLHRQHIETVDELNKHKLLLEDNNDKIDSYLKEVEELRKQIDLKETATEDAPVSALTDQLKALTEENTEYKRVMTSLHDLLHGKSSQGSGTPSELCNTVSDLATKIFEQDKAPNNKKFVSKIPTRLSPQYKILPSKMSLAELDEDETPPAKTLVKTKSQSMPNLDEPVNYSYADKMSSADNLHVVVDEDDRWDKRFETLQSLRKDMDAVLVKLNESKDPLSAPLVHANYHKTLIAALQWQVNNLQVAAKENANYGLQSKSESEALLRKLHDELEATKHTKIEEYERLLVKKDAELNAIKENLNRDIMDNKQKLLKEIDDLQSELQAKSEDELVLRQKVEQLSRSEKQGVRKKKVTNVSRPSTSGAAKHSKCTRNISDKASTYPGVQVMSCPIIRPLPAMYGYVPQTSPAVENPSSISDILHTQLDMSIKRHRILSDPAPIVRSSSDEDLQKKYLVS